MRTPGTKLPEQPAVRPISGVPLWLGHLFREWTMESWRPIAAAALKPEPSKWDDAQVTLAWIGHSTVLINFFGVTILTDPVLSSRIGIRLPGFTIGPKRLTAPALPFNELPKVDLVLLSHAHFDHLDLRTLQRSNSKKAPSSIMNIATVTAPQQKKNRIGSKPLMPKMTAISRASTNNPMPYRPPIGLGSASATEGRATNISVMIVALRIAC